MVSKIYRKILIELELIKFPHTVFALPFALASTFLASKGLPSIDKFFWIIVAMVGARSAAMGLNRIIDKDIDSLNPRTVDRALPRGLIKASEVYVLIGISLIAFLIAAIRLNPLCLKLSPFVIAVIVIYPYLKRITCISHFVLGLALGIAPAGAWIAIKGVIEIPPVIIGVAVIFWVAGFDVLYALQDFDFDSKYGFFSIPRLMGVKKSLYLARSMHIIAVILLYLISYSINLGKYYIAGILVIAILFIYEHSLIKENDLSKLDIAFFNMNGIISIFYFIFTILDIFLP